VARSQSPFFNWLIVMPGCPRTRRALSPWFIFLVAGGIRLVLPLAAWVATERGPLVREPDSQAYLELADGLASGGPFERAGRPELERTPGYPAFLAVARALAAPDAVILIAQALLGGATAVIVFRTAQALADNDTTPAAAGWIVACEPSSALYCGKVLTETLFTLLLACAVLGLARFARNARLSTAAVAGAWLAAAILVRPIAYYLPTVMALALVLVGGKSRWSGRRLGAIAVFWSCAMAAAAAWQIRNHARTEYGGYSAIQDVNLYFWLAAGVEAAAQDRSLSEVQSEMGYSDEATLLARFPELEGASFQSRYALFRREAARICAASPRLAISTYASGVAATVFDPGTNAWLDYFGCLRAGAAEIDDKPWWSRLAAAVSTRPAYAALWAVLAAANWMLLAASVLGAAILARRTRGGWVCLVVLAYLVALSGGPPRSTRMKSSAVAARSNRGRHPQSARAERSSIVLGQVRNRRTASGRGSKSRRTPGTRAAISSANSPAVGAIAKTLYTHRESCLTGARANPTIAATASSAYTSAGAVSRGTWNVYDPRRTDSMKALDA
jgi:hypothetical protein